MEVFPSLRGLSSVAIGPVVMMNWRRIVAYFPAVERLIDGMDSEKLLHALLGTRTGLSMLGVLGSVMAAHFLHLAWNGAWRLVMGSFYTKCSLSEHSNLHDQVLNWITKNPKFQSATTVKIMDRTDDKVEVSDTEDSIDIERMVNEIVRDCRCDQCCLLRYAWDRRADPLLATHFPPRDWPGPLLAQGRIYLDV